MAKKKTSGKKTAKSSKKAPRHVHGPDCGHDHDLGIADDMMQNCLIVCPMAVDSPALAALPMDALANVFSIAVDGGLSHFELLGLEPEVWIGDGDSITEETKKKTAKQKFPRMMLKADKAYSDLEFALHFAGESLLEKQWTGDVILIGAQGGRFDHELGNMLAVDRWLRDIASTVGVDECPTVFSYGDHGVWIATISGVAFEHPKGEVFSVFAFDQTTRLTINGAKYSLKGKALEHATHGLGNVGRGKDVSIRVESGPKGAIQPAFVIFPST
jgi:thiamine pyrophosphokinase